MSKKPPPDQHLIDNLYRNLKGEDANSSGKNGSGDKGRANPGASKLPDQAVLTKMFGEAKRGDELRDIYHGDYAKHRPDWTNSEAVASILRKAAFYSGNDPVQMERAIRGSALASPKFDEARGGSTWLADEIQKAIDDTPETYQDRKTHQAHKIHSFDPMVEDLNESISLPWRSAKQISEETPAETSWIVRPWFAEQTITEVAGQIKRSGKTTFLAACARKVVAGEAFLGQPTKRTKVLYLTEQGPASFRRVIKMARLEDREDFQALYLQDVLHLPWPEIIRLATDYARKTGAGLLIVDVLTTWARIEGDGENSAGIAQEAMRPLKAAVAAGLTVVYARHDRKSGGEVGQSGRGSSQFGGDADQLLLLKRSEGNTRPTVRVLEAVGRFGDDTPDSLMIELNSETGEYKSLGDLGAFVEREAMSVVVEILPTTEDEALSTQEVVLRAGEFSCKRSAAINALNKLSAAGTIARTGEGKKGSPRRYYKPLPDEGEEGDTEKDSFETLTPRDQTNESEPDQHPLECECIDCQSTETKTVRGWEGAL